MRPGSGPDMAGDTADRILDAAEYRMRRGGYNAVSFRHLAEDLGIRSASVHHHFARKEALAVALVTRYCERFFAALEGATAGADTPADRLRAFSDVYRNNVMADDAMCLGGLLGAEMAGLPEVVQEAVRALLRANIDWVSGVLPDTLSPAERRKRADSFVAAHQGAMMISTGLEDVDLFDGISHGMIAFALRDDGA